MFQKAPYHYFFTRENIGKKSHNLFSPLQKLLPPDVNADHQNDDKENEKGQNNAQNYHLESTTKEPLLHNTIFILLCKCKIDFCVNWPKTLDRQFLRKL